MPITTQRYIRKPLYVDAVRITAANFEEIAAWCQGDIQHEDVPGKGTSKKFIRVRVQNPKNPRQTKAFVGDWILYTETGYKVYTVKAFHAAFDKVEAETATVVNQGEEQEVPVAMHRVPEGLDEIDDPEPGKVEPDATEGRRVLSAEEQQQMTTDEIRDMVQSGEVVLAQDIAR
ncbi:MAG TPA: hypothetical protein VEO92_03070, partial [Candidatus Nitrosocosmicus sp.]|nr:hypothetical protein [Candidatus Nitrosocosmicus sp.]